MATPTFQVAVAAGLLRVLSVMAFVVALTRILWKAVRRPKRATASNPERPGLLVEAAAPLQRQVFLSHTGRDDTAKHFTASILKPALELAGLKVVIDYDFLQPGVDWSQELVEAAANSAVFVAVLSRSYTKRFWCMLELDLAINAHTQRVGQQSQQGDNGALPTSAGAPWIIPVFLDSCEDVVQPAGILQHWSRQAAGRHGGAQLHGAKLEQEKWLDAEGWAANVSRTLVLQNLQLTSFVGKDQLHQLARAVVQAAVQRLPPMVKEGTVVGLDGRIEQLVVELSGRLGVWLHGIGGIGKTTSAKRLANRLYANGLFQCMVIVELQHDDGDNMTKLAGHLQRALKKLDPNSAKPPEGSAAELAQKLQDLVSKRRVLYVLDNVWTVKQLEHLLPTEWGTGSVVIITSREACLCCDTLDKVEERLLFRSVELLDSRSAKQLFRSCAGLGEGPPAGLLGLEEELLRRCARLPVALRIVGGSLRGSSKDVNKWRAVLASLKQGALAADKAHELQGVLEHSLRGLPNEAVSMFLDVATILRHNRIAGAMPMWEAWHGEGARDWFDSLRQRSLVDLALQEGKDEDGALLAMHDVVVVLGRRMVLDKNSPHYGTRLWVEDGRIVGVPKVGAQACKVLAAQLDLMGGNKRFAGNEAYPPSLDLSAAGMDWTDVKIFNAGRVQVPPGKAMLCVAVSDWGQLVGDLPLGHTVLNTATDLRMLHVDNCSNVRALPACVRRMTGLRHLALHNCASLVSGVEHVSALPALQGLFLSGCSILAGLPQRLHLPSLKWLCLSDCGQLVALPDSMGCLPSLQHLALDGCSQLAAVPGSLGKLAALTHLRLAGCSQLNGLPGALGQLGALRVLSLQDCSQIRAVPGCVGCLTSLQYLALGGCSELAGLPDCLGRLAALTGLDLPGCSQLVALPASVGQLASLQVLNVRGCSQLSTLPGTIGLLSKLTYLNLSQCSQLAQLPEAVGQLAALRALYLDGCSQLAALPSAVTALTSLQELLLDGCSQLAALPDSIGQLTLLTALGLSNCSGLTVLPRTMGDLVSLQALDLRGCLRLAALPDAMAQLTQLTALRLACCKLTEACCKLTEAPHWLAPLCLLRDLALQGFTELAALPDVLWLLTALTMLSTRQCAGLLALPTALGGLACLAHLDLNGCSRLSALPDELGSLTALTALDFENCSALTALPESLGQLTSLQVLDAKSCLQLTLLPDSLGQLNSLTYLRLRGCSKLTALPATIGGLSSLQQLHLSGCSRLTELPAAMGQLTSLRRLHLSGCTQLAALPVSVFQLTSLQHFTLKGCTQLEPLPEAVHELLGLLQAPPDCESSDCE